MSNKEYNITHTQMGGGELKEDLGGGSSALTPATADTLGGVKIGNGISVTEDGTISAQGGGDTAPTPEATALYFPKYTSAIERVMQGADNIPLGKHKYMEIAPIDNSGASPIDFENIDLSKLPIINNYNKDKILNGDFILSTYNATLDGITKLRPDSIMDLGESIYITFNTNGEVLNEVEDGLIDINTKVIIKATINTNPVVPTDANHYFMISPDDSSYSITEFYFANETK